MTCLHLSSLNIRPPTTTQSVYKDDCTQCFDTPDQPWGLDVCLSCFNGGCDSPDRNHSRAHYLLSDHPIVLNIKRKLKPRKERAESPTKIVKLSISAENEDDKYETTTTIKCLACNGQELNKSLPELSAVVEGVLSALSSSKKSEVKAWEQEILPCEHTLCLEQDQLTNKEERDLSHCSQCDLTENLWICLQCGNLGCGRQQFGGVGGNGHGLAHFESTKHPVSVKLGSITPEGTADVYCYLCNEERQDPELAKHLEHWGILIAERIKVEKSLVELQLEQNLKWEFSMTTENGEELEPLFGSGFTGIKNLGNSCYLASVVQCLFSLQPFIDRYYRHGELPLTLEPATNLETQLRKLADGLLSGRYSQPEAYNSDEAPYQKGIAPSMFKALIGKNHEEFSTMRQQDAFEFLIYIIQEISRASVQSKQTDPTKIFNFVSEQRLQCLGCHKVNYKSDVQSNISVAVPIERLLKDNPEDKDTFRSIPLKECLDNFTADEKIEYFCQACGSKSGAIKRTAFKTFPDVLVVNARRFEIVNWVPSKIDVPVEVPDHVFSLDEYLSKGLQPGEELLPEETSTSSVNIFTPNEGILSVLEGMGFPTERCKKALYNTGNSDPDSAMNWLFAHMEDPDIDEPLVFEVVSGTDFTADEGSIAMLVDMGFTDAQAKKALKETGSDVERSVEWLFSHPDDNGTEESVSDTNAATSVIEEGNASLPAKFALQSTLCHKGTSVNAGHYVAFVKKQIGAGGDENADWVLFNDEKVVKGGDAGEMKKFAYVYFFERV
ncbi:hypothetical protein V1514DRAFT_55170 [Lipomyces japonicus]|uniref:uncharacterized protein n=1 Tax=Lipomyces japonicus TaxID=56871 RepID=UPI0034CDF86C